MISTIALDLDGTLLDPEGNVSSANRVALERATDRGISIMLSSGRHHFDVSWIARGLTPVSYLASSNGAFMTDGSGHPVHSDPMNDHEVASVAEAIGVAGLSAVWYAQDRIVIDAECPVLPWYRRRDDAIGNLLRLSVQDDPAASIRAEHDTVYKVAVNHDDIDRFDSFERELDARGIAWTSSSPHNREIMGRGVSKAVAAGAALELLGAERESLVAVGDGSNDIDLIGFAGFGFAMENACGELKAVADRVCPSNGEDGVAFVIDRVFQDRVAV